MNQDHLFRSGVNFSVPASGTQQIDMPRSAEAMGYHSLQLPDHLGDHLGSGSALVLAAEATKALHFANYVLGNDFRNPFSWRRNQLPSTSSPTAVHFA